MNFDVAIIGGGPSGCAAALTLLKHRPELAVVIIEASDYSKLRPGETLSPPVGELLKELGIWRQFLDQGFVEAFGTRSIWGGEESENNFLYLLNGSGWHVDRRRFDNLMAESAAQAGAKVQKATKLISATTNSSGQWQLELQPVSEESISYSATWVIDASGRSAVFAKKMGATITKMDRLCGVMRIYEEKDGAPENDSFTLIEAAENGWWYSSILPGNGLVLVWMSDSDIINATAMNVSTTWEMALKLSPRTAQRTSGYIKHSALHIFPASTQVLNPKTGRKWVAAGDACYSMDPLSGQGIFKALRNGAMASFLIVDAYSGREDSANKFAFFLKGEFQTYLNQKFEIYQQCDRWAHSLFWKRRTLPITLSPYAKIKTVIAAQSPIPVDSALTVEELKTLLEFIGNVPQTAHSILTRFKSIYGDGISDKRLLAGLQSLVEAHCCEIVVEYVSPQMLAQL